MSGSSSSFGNFAFGVSSFGPYVSPNIITNATARYPMSVWSAVKMALTYGYANMSPTNPQASFSLIKTIGQTLRNGVEAINAYQLYTALQASYSNVSSIEALPLTLDATSSATLTAYVNTLQGAAAQSSAGSLLVPLATNTSRLSMGVPTVGYPGLLEWQMNFRMAATPTGLTYSNFAAYAAAFATSWSNIISAVQTGGVNYTASSLTEIQNIFAAAQVCAFEVSQLTFSPATDLTAAWNLLVVLPTMTRVASLAANDPTSASAQQLAAIRYVALSLYKSFNTLIVSFNNTTPNQIQMVPVRYGDSLMDIAAREMGDYTQWTAIAAANNLLPPYISSTPGPNVAVVGQLLFLPSSTVSQQSPIGNFETYFLGTDIYYGPLNTDMNAWTGDLQVISGYQNLALSLGRRLQTTLGTLIYDTSFGSRIPPEVGAIATNRTPAQIEAYATSALLSDPRVDSVKNVKVSTNPLGLVAVLADVIPKGPGNFGVPVSVSTVLGQ